MKIAIPLVLTALTASALAQTQVYSNASPRANSTVIAGSEVGAPALSMWGGCTTDGAQMYVQGGRAVSSSGTASATTYYNTLDAYDPVANTWTNLTAEGDPTAPSTRFRQAMAYDPLLNRLVVFGGRATASGTIFSDCYAFDLGTNTWSQILNPTPGTTGPLARFDSGLEFDASTGNLVLFGGQNTGTNTSRLADTWLLSGTTWTQATPVTNPPARSIHSMTARSAPYDDVVVVAGRSASGNAILTDTWRWDGLAGDWVQITPINATTPVTFGGGNDAVYDAIRQVVTILYGATIGGTSYPGSYRISEYDCVTNEWRAFADPAATNEDPTFGAPQRFAVAFLNGKTYWWGGQNGPSTGDNLLPFVKEYQADPLALSSIIGTGCAGSAGPMALSANDAPWTGRDWTVTGTGFPATAIGGLILGLGTHATPIPVATLHPAGGIGCDVLVMDDLTTLVYPSGGQASFSVSVPYTTFLVGLPLNAQMFSVEIDASNIITLITSTNGVGGVVGAL